MSPQPTTMPSRGRQCWRFCGSGGLYGISNINDLMKWAGLGESRGKVGGTVPAVKLSGRTANLAGEWVGLSELAPGGKCKFMAVKVDQFATAE